jgi:hypothetical protein
LRELLITVVGTKVDFAPHDSGTRSAKETA